MNKGIFLINEFEALDGYRSAGVSVIEFDWHVCGTTLPLCIGVDCSMARLADIVPLAQAVSDRLCAAVIENLAADHQQVHCHKGCSACCSYLVALSIPEVFSLQDELASLAINDRTALLKSCLTAARRILDKDRVHDTRIFAGGDLAAISQWYTELGLLCPFLDEGICRIYEKRPLACRAYMVTTSPAYCQPRTLQSPDIVEMPIHLVEILGELAAELEKTEVESLLLPLAVFCEDDYRLRSERLWPAEWMIRRFVACLEKAVRPAAVTGPAVSSP